MFRCNTPLSMAAALVLAGVAARAVEEGKKPKDGPPFQLDEKLTAYEPRAEVSGTIVVLGTDSLYNVLALLAHGFEKHHPGARVERRGDPASSSGALGLIRGLGDIGMMSRKMTDKETTEFKEKHGHEPSHVPILLDALAVFVHKENPIGSLSLVEVDAIFSKTRRAGHPKDIKTWGDLGLDGEWKERPIVLHGRNSASGTYGFFKEYALFKGDYRDEIGDGRRGSDPRPGMKPPWSLS